VFRGAATIAATLAVLGAAALSAPSAGAAEPCPTPPLCVETDENGTYVLHVPPLSLVALLYPQVAPLQDCYWEVVEVDFGDGTAGEIYEWDATKELTGSHTFPEPGTYTVQIDATQGHHVSSGEPCPDFPITAYVTFPEPPPVEPPSGPPPGEPPGEGGAPGPSQGSTTPQAPGQLLGPDPPAAEPTAYWRRCGGRVLAHGVACRKARKVAGRAPGKLVGRKSARVAGFSCALQPALPLPIACRRGADRILAPAA
jgi:hypothetical protein